MFTRAQNIAANQYALAQPSPIDQVFHDIAYLNKITLRLLFFQCFTFLYFFTAHNAFQNTHSEYNANIINIFGQILIITGNIYACFKLLSQNPKFILNPVFGFCAGTILFYGVGAFAHIFANDQTKLYLIYSSFGATSNEIIRANLLVSVGSVVVLGTLAVCFSLKIIQNALINISKTQRVGVSLETLAAFLILIGLSIKYLLIIPFRFEQVEWILPTILISIPFLADIGFCLIIYAKNKITRFRRYIYLAMWIIYASLTFLEFLKLSVVLALTLPAIGHYLRTKSKIRLICNMSVIALMFTVYQPLCLAGRQLIYNDTGSIYKASMTERASYIYKAIFYNHDTKITGDSRVSKTWIRISSVGSQTHAMKLFDNGNSPNTYRDILWILTPRFLWPDKPEVNLPGKAFYSAVTKKRTSYVSFSISVYGDGYWNFGWIGVIIFSILTGIICYILSILSHVWLVFEKFVYLPAILLALEMMVKGINQSFLSGIIVPFIVFCVTITFTAFLLGILQSYQSRIALNAQT